MDSRQAILPVALRVNVNLFQTDLCQDPVYKDELIYIAAYLLKLHYKSADWMLCKCHPWQLDSGSPCRNDDSTTWAISIHLMTRLHF